MYGSPGDFLDRTNDSDPAGPDIVHERTIENGYDIVDGVLFGEWQGRIGKTMRAQVADHAALQEAQVMLDNARSEAQRMGEAARAEAASSAARRERMALDRIDAAEKAAVSDVRQTSMAMQFSRLLSRQTTGQVSLRWHDVRGLNARAGEQSEWVAVRASLQHQIAPRTEVFAGVQTTRFESNAQGQRDFRANDVFVGLKHRFGR